MTARDEMGELLPCPFCGSPAEIIDIEDGENAGGSCVSCTRCEASSALDFGRKENFVSKWNNRPSPARDEGAGTKGRGEVAERLRSIRRTGSYAESVMAAYGSRPREQFWDDLDAILTAPVSAPGMDREEADPEKPWLWFLNERLGGYQAVFDAIGDAVSVPYAGAKEISVISFMKALWPHVAQSYEALLDNGQEVTSPTDGSQVEPSTTGAGRQIIPTDDQGGEGT